MFTVATEFTVELAAATAAMLAALALSHSQPNTPDMNICVYVLI